jgi:hypothetical protein
LSQGTSGLLDLGDHYARPIFRLDLHQGIIEDLPGKIRQGKVEMTPTQINTQHIAEVRVDPDALAVALIADETFVDEGTNLRGQRRGFHTKVPGQLLEGYPARLRNLTEKTLQSRFRLSVHESSWVARLKCGAQV